MDEKIRLQKYMSECGAASRRASEELIKAGKVKVNGRKASLGDKINAKRDIVTVSGKRISLEKNTVTIMLNKPRGYITTVSDELGRKTVMDLVGDINERIYPVGRLDKDSQGMLIMTNDGELANYLMHPSNNIKKRYIVTVKGNSNDEAVEKLRNGVLIDGVKTAPAMINILESKSDRQMIDFTLAEGKNREIRKMCSEVGLEIMRLKRVAIGDLKLENLPIGKWRQLSDNEVKLLKHGLTSKSTSGQKI